MRQPFFLWMGLSWAVVFVVSGLTAHRFRVGRTADDPRYDAQRKRIGRHVAVWGAAIVLVIFVPLAFLV